MSILSEIMFLWFLCWFLRRGQYTGSSLKMLEDDQKDAFLGSLNFLPSSLSHARRALVEARYHYKYIYFMLGVPVGFRGRIGSLIAFDLPFRELWRSF